MATQFDEKLFDDSTKYDESLFEEAPSEIGMTESALRGAASGASFGFADELAAAAETAGRAALPESMGGDKLADLLENYRKYRGESREAFKAAEEANPTAYMVGDIGAGVATGLLTGGAGAVANLGRVGVKQGVKELAKMGARQGAATGLGMTESDLTKGEIGGATKDVVTGGLIGGVAGAALPSVVKGAGEALGAVGDFAMDKAPSMVKKGKQAFELAKKGVEVVGAKAQSALDADSSKAANEIIDAFKKQYEQGSTMVGSALKSVPDQDFSAQMSKIENALKTSKMLPDDLNRIQNELDMYKKLSTTETVEPGIEKAIAKMENLISKAKSEAKALGQDVTFSPIENVDDKFLQTVQTKNIGDELIDSKKVAQEGTGLSKAQESMSQKIAKVKAQANQLNEKVTVSEPIFDQESNSLISTVISLDKNGNPVAKTITQSVPKDVSINVPTFADKLSSVVNQVDIPEDKVITDTVESFRNMNLQELNNVKKELSTFISSNKNISSHSKSILSGIKKELDDTIKTAMNPQSADLYKSGNIQMKDVYDAGELLGMVSPDQKFAKDLDIGLKSKLLSGAKQTQETLERGLDYGTQLTPELRASVKELPLRQELLKDVKGEGGMFGGLINPRGLAIRTGEAIGKVSGGKSVETAKDFTRKMINMSDDNLLNMSTKMSNSQNEAVKSLGTTLTKALQDTTKRDRLIWALSQQPAFREAFRSTEQEDGLLGQ